MKDNETHHARFMRECFRLAERGKGSVSPNPLVGAVLVKKGRIVARGFHARFGGPHAEVECLRSFRGNPGNATLYVNLEPCSHHGKTPPCADLIFKSGIRRVVVGMKDPNPLVAGKGIRKLRSAGVDVMTGILERDARDLNRAFITHITKRRPFVHVKVAQTLDGKIALRGHSRTAITGSKVKELVHRWRAEHDAVLVGAGTIRADNPSLTVRSAKGRNPTAVILDGHLSIDSHSRLLNRDFQRRVIIFTSANALKKHRKKYQQFLSQGAIVVAERSSDNSLSLSIVLKRLHRLNIGSVLVEGGTRVFTEFMNKGLVDQVSIFIAPQLFSDKGIPAFENLQLGKAMASRLASANMSFRKLGSDILLDFMFDR